jgi:2-phospho-L-lactate guanylyltransferase (CobY/MobA/RfbA family)
MDRICDHSSFLTYFSQSALDRILKILLYAPGDEKGLEIMRGVLQDLDIHEASSSSPSSSSSSSSSTNGWKLLPMKKKDLQATDLGDLLHHALDRARDLTAGGVVFLGMDSPGLPLDDICRGLNNNSTAALLCPADDGGYGMLCVPPTAPADKTFRGVLWSHSLTAVSQMKALTDQGIYVAMGTLMHDIDEPEDVQRLVERLAIKQASTKEKYGALSLCSGGIPSRILSGHPMCFYTRKALIEAGLFSS